MSNIGNKEIFAKNLQYYIARSHRSQKEIAEAVGVSPSTFNEWVKGKKYPRIDKIEMLANYFHIQKSSLIEEKTKNKTLDKNQLTEGEELLLKLYRAIPDDRKQMAIEVLKVTLQTK